MKFTRSPYTHPPRLPSPIHSRYCPCRTAPAPIGNVKYLSEGRFWHQVVSACVRVCVRVRAWRGSAGRGAYLELEAGVADQRRHEPPGRAARQRLPKRQQRRDWSPRSEEIRTFRLIENCLPDRRPRRHHHVARHAAPERFKNIQI